VAVPAEIQFAAVVALIYLLDGFVLLHVNEGVVERGRRLRILFGSAQPWIAGKRVLLLDPWRPLATAWRTSWAVRASLDPPPNAESARALMDERVRVLAVLDPYVIVVWALVLVAAPLALFALTTAAFLLVAALAWLSVWVLVVRLACLRKALDLSRAAYALVAFECLACPPVAANLPRKLSLRMPPGSDLVAFVDAPARAAVHRQLVRDLEARLLFLDLESSAYRDAVAYRDLLLASAIPAMTDEET
jgi:hypothetical protein